MINEARQDLRAFVLGVIATAAVAGTILDVTVGSVSGWFGNHQFATAVFAELLLLGAVYLGLDHLLKTSEEKRWRDATRDKLNNILTLALMTDEAIDGCLEDDRTVTANEAEIERAFEWSRAFQRAVQDNLIIFTASPYMIGFLKYSTEASSNSGYLLSVMSGDGVDARQVRKNYERYDESIRAFMEKYKEVLASEIARSEKWADLLGLAYRPVRWKWG
jgi:hypothetical protein